MNIREVTALVLLYRACGDATLRARVQQLVPGLAELADVVVPLPSDHHGPVITFGKGMLWGQKDGIDPTERK